jgi:hypothetical protein
MGKKQVILSLVRFTGAPPGGPFYLGQKGEWLIWGSGKTVRQDLHCITSPPESKDEPPANLAVDINTPKQTDRSMSLLKVDNSGARKALLLQGGREVSIDCIVIPVELDVQANHSRSSPG